jgi:hypothetical protein
MILHDPVHANVRRWCDKSAENVHVTFNRLGALLNHIIAMRALVLYEQSMRAGT